MNKPLMPKATAVWLVENTALTFDQIADFCGLHMLEVQAIADEEVAIGMQGMDPIVNGQVTKEEIVRCEGDPSTRLDMLKSDIPQPTARGAGPRYTPLSKRQDKPDAIAWLLRHYPELSDAQISRIVGTTKTTINAVRDRTHWKGANISPVDPVDIGICTYEELLAEVQTARKRKERAEARAAKATAKQEREAAKEGVLAGVPETAAPVAEEPAAGGAVNPYHEHLPMEQPKPSVPDTPTVENVFPTAPSEDKDGSAGKDDDEPDRQP